MRLPVIIRRQDSLSGCKKPCGIHGSALFKEKDLKKKTPGKDVQVRIHSLLPVKPAGQRPRFLQGRRAFLMPVLWIVIVFGIWNYTSAVYASSVPAKKNITVKLTVKGSTKTVTVDPGTVIRIKAKQGKKKIAAAKLKITSSKKAVAKVSSTGQVTAKKQGTAVIRIKRKGKKTKAALKVIVKKRTYTANAASEDPSELLPDTSEVSAATESAMPSGYLHYGPVSTGQMPHQHIWYPVVLSDPEAPAYPADRCSVCGLERWTFTESSESSDDPESSGSSGGTAASSAAGTFKGRIVMIGDSSGARSSNWGGNYTWPYQVAKGLGLTEGQAWIACKGGYGFAVSGSFTNLLRLVDPDPDVTHVLVVGGIGNDQYQSKDAIKIGCKVFALEVKTRFPKAKVIYAAPNTHISNESWLEKLAEHRPWYIEACKENGWIYLSGCEKILAGRTELFRADGHPPNEEGEVVLGEALTKKLRAVL